MPTTYTLPAGIAWFIGLLALYGLCTLIISFIPYPDLEDDTE